MNRPHPSHLLLYKPLPSKPPKQTATPLPPNHPTHPSPSPTRVYPLRTVLAAAPVQKHAQLHLTQPHLGGRILKLRRPPGVIRQAQLLALALVCGHLV